MKAWPLLAATACAAHLAVERWVPAPAVKRAALESTLPRRDECLAPPYTLANDQPMAAQGLRLEPRGDGLPRELYVMTPHGQPFDADGLLAFRDRNASALRAIDGVESSGLSGCPTREGPSPCIHLDLRLCARTLDALAADLSRIVAADTEVLGRRVIFHITLTGAAGPRCEAQDPTCRPEPYEAAEYEPGAHRGLLAKVTGATQCSWDGECKKSGCGNACESWTQAHRPGSCEERPELRDALCGCVEQRCAWFVQ